MDLHSNIKIDIITICMKKKRKKLTITLYVSLLWRAIHFYEEAHLWWYGVECQHPWVQRPQQVKHRKVINVCILRYSDSPLGMCEWCILHYSDWYSFWCVHINSGFCLNRNKQTFHYFVTPPLALKQTMASEDRPCNTMDHLPDL